MFNKILTIRIYQNHGKLNKKSSIYEKYFKNYFKNHSSRDDKPYETS